jgi:hypothetical protein
LHQERRAQEGRGGQRADSRVHADSREQIADRRVHAESRVLVVGKMCALAVENLMELPTTTTAAEERKEVFTHNAQSLTEYELYQLYRSVAFAAIMFNFLS